MLNRIYIVVGVLAIIVLGGAFIAPHLIQWGDYRTRMEALATQVLGSPVTIRGNIEFTLLPQPRLSFTNVLVGSPEEPAATVDSVEAEFSLMDFLGDNYDLTKLVLRGPVVDFTVDESGLFGSGVQLAAAEGGVALREASIVGGTLRLLDKRVGESFVVSALEGNLRLSSLAGPFQFQGTGSYGGEGYSARINAALADASGASRISAFVQPVSAAFSLSTEGVLTAGIAPKFDGTLTYKQVPPVAETADDIRGDLVLESKVTASTDRIVLSGYTLQPDQNRAGTRLTGAASIRLGAGRSFDAVVSGGVFALPPRDAKEDQSQQPYEAVRLLSELPPPLLPPLPGRVGIDLAEVGLRGFALRDVRVDASTDGKSWAIETFIARLPGDTELTASGKLVADGAHPAFDGRFHLGSQRLDALVALWRKPTPDTPLFNQAGSLDGSVMLKGDALRIGDAALTLAGAKHAVDLRLGFGEEKRLDVVGHFADLGAEGSDVLAAMLPSMTADTGFGISFPAGSFALSSTAARLFGQDGTDLVANGQWSGDAVDFARLSAGNWGGLGFDAAVKIGGDMAAPALSGSGRLSIARGDAPALTAIYDLVGMPQGWRDYLARSAPAEMLVDLEPRVDGGAQVVTLGGTAGAGQLNLRAEMGDGLSALTTGQLRLTGSLEGADTAALLDQLGLGDAALMSGEGLLASVSLSGSPSNSLDSRINLSSGAESLGFSGNLVSVSDGEIQGTGDLTLDLADAGGLAQIVGASGVSLPLAKGTAQLHFEGNRLARLEGIAGTSGDTAFSGALELTRSRDATAVSGDLEVDRVSVEALAASVFGRAALVSGGEIWPEGPLNASADARPTRGTVSVTARTLTAGGQTRLGKTSFDFTWDETKVRLARFEAASDGGGTLSLDLSACCAGPIAEQTVSGRLTVKGLPLSVLAPTAISDQIAGQLDGSAQFEGSGVSLGEVMTVLAGEGSFSIAGFSANQLAPGVFPSVASIEDVLNTDADTLKTLIGVALGQGAFTAPTAAGAFTIAGGVARVNNLVIDGPGARLSGDVSVNLPSLGLSGGFALTPLGYADAKGLVSPDISRISTSLGGTVLAPEVTLDLDEIVAGLQVRANEVELDRLEALRAEDAARQKAAAEARNRLIEEQRRKAAEEAARLAAEQAARDAEAAAQAEAQRKAEQAAQQQQLQQQQTQPQTTTPPAETAPSVPSEQTLDLSLPPPVNQPLNFQVNEPLFQPIN
ncbi:AsmA-like C-terminal region-containing protein [Devosia sp. FKR38]|uniref:AsmA family protein n=1 Tax=Devosia sp. FKR38 TaxID=2562312 RepID=UPI001485C29E|nr:AsmA-like C-terminal region-containing protein [Devosia sp. FKR38]